MKREQLQDADVLPGPGLYTQSLGKSGTQLGKHGRQLPVAIHRCVIESGRLVQQRAQEVKGIEDLLATAVTSDVGGDDSAVPDHFDAIDIPLHTHLSEREPAWDAITVAVEPGGLVLVHQGRLNHTRIERTRWHRQRGGTILLEPHTH
jgi:hypothetical protein